MAQIGTFTAASNGGWSGSIRTLTIDVKARFVPNDNRENENAPAFRLLVGQSRIGDAWLARSSGENAKDYLKVRIDDPSLYEPINAALFPSEDGNAAQLVWSRR